MVFVAVFVGSVANASIKYDELRKGETYKFVGSTEMMLACYQPETTLFENTVVHVGSDSKVFQVLTAVVAYKRMTDVVFPPVEKREIRFTNFSSDPKFDLCYLKLSGEKYFWGAHADFLEEVAKESQQGK